MRYMLMIYADEALEEAMPEAEMGKLMGEYMKFDQELEASGAYQSSARLQPEATATTVRVRKGDVLKTDGPFAETKEALGGYYIIDVPDLDAALEWARKVPSAAYGSVEVRPVWEMEG